MKPAQFLVRAFSFVVSFAGISLLAAIAGCVGVHGSLPGGGGAPALVLGEHAAYRVVNRLPPIPGLAAGGPSIEMPILTDAAGRVLYANLHAVSEYAANPYAANPIRRNSHGNSAVSSPVSATAVSASISFEKDPGDEDLALPRQPARAMVVAPGGHRVPDTIFLGWRERPRPGQTVYSGATVAPVSVSLRSQIPAAVLARIRDQWRYRLDIEVIALSGDLQLRWRLLYFTDTAVQEIHRGGSWTDAGL